jgi:hypothetical protein
MRQFRLATLSVLFSGAAAAGPLYVINFTGTVIRGSASGFNTSLGALTQFADLTNAHVSGSLSYDLGVAPAPGTNVSSGLTSIGMQTTDLAVFMTESFAIDGFTVPGGYLPMPTTFELPAIPTVPGSIVTTTPSNQTLWFYEQAPAQVMLTQMTFQNTWTGALQGTSIVNLGVVAADYSAPFFTRPPPGSLPAAWGPVPSGPNGTFHFAVVSQDPAVQENFGYTELWQVKGDFTLNSASGDFVGAPEPGTLWLSAAFLALAAVERRKLRRCPKN